MNDKYPNNEELSLAGKLRIILSVQRIEITFSSTKAVEK